MMRRLQLVSAMACVFSLASAGVLAQQTTTIQTTTQSGPSTAGYQEIKDEKIVVQPYNITVDRMDDMKVVSATGERIGEIDEVLADATGRPVAVTVEVGGFLGIGDREVIIPLDQLQLQGDRFMVTMTKQQIEALPKWDS